MEEYFPKRRKLSKFVCETPIENCPTIVLPKKGIRITPQIRKLLLNNKGVKDDTIMGCWILGKDVTTRKIKQNGLLKSYYLSNGDPDIILNRFGNDDFPQLVNHLKAIAGQPGMVPIVRFGIREYLIEFLRNESMSSVDKTLHAFDEFGIRFIAYSYYQPLLVDNIKTLSISKLYQLVLAYGPILRAIKYSNDDIDEWNKYKSIIAKLEKYHRLKDPESDLPFDEYIRYGISGRYPGLTNVNNASSILDPLVYSLNSKHSEKLLIYSYDEYKGYINNTKYKFNIKKHPISLNLDKSKKWTVPAAAQYFELQLDNSVIKCDGIIYMIMKILDDGNTKSLDFIKSKTGLSMELLQENIDKLHNEGIIFVNHDGYWLTDNFQGDEVVVIV